jgi:RNA polymerase sigma-70 factor (ECF subfamily)
MSARERVRLDLGEGVGTEPALRERQDSLFIGAAQGNPSCRTSYVHATVGPAVGTLAEIYLAAVPEGTATGEVHSIERRLGELCARGRAAHPAFGLSDEVFVAHLATCGAPVLEVRESPHVEDLYLACAALAGNTAAVGRLQSDAKPILARSLTRIAGGKVISDEVEQQLWRSLLVGTGDGPKLASYAGRGALGGWIAVSGQRIALMILRHERVEARVRQEAAAQRNLVSDDPELRAIKARFREELQAALDGALRGLGDRERTIYRMHLVDDLPIVHIAKVYGVHHATILRWLSAARARIVDDAKRNLRATLSVSSGEFDSIARLLVSQLDLSISKMLRK